MTMTRNSCPDCGGTRYGTPSDCPNCDGSGRKDGQPCGLCHGRGHINHTCSTCDGTGVR